MGHRSSPRHEHTRKARRGTRAAGLTLLIYLLPPVLVGAIVVFAVTYWNASEPAVATRPDPVAAESRRIVEEQVNSPTGDPDAPRIYLTFDDGPSAESTPAILDILAVYEVQATFFTLGYMAENYPDTIVRQHAAGHVIANHGYSHDYDALYASADAFMANLRASEEVLTGILGQQPPRITRFPAGSAALQLENNPVMRDAIKERLAADGWRFFDWTVSIGDSILEAPAAGELSGRLNAAIDEQVAAGNRDIVVLAHDVDAKPWTPRDLPAVLDHCLASGYVFRTLSMESPPVEYR